MQKLLLFIFVLWVIYAVRRFFQQKSVAPQSRDEAAEPAAAEVMRECRQCGLLVPESEAVRVREHFYCSLEHAQTGEPGGRP